MCDFFCGLQALKDLNISEDKVHVLFDLCFSVYLFFFAYLSSNGISQSYFIFVRIFYLFQNFTSC